MLDRVYQSGESETHEEYRAQLNLDGRALDRFYKLHLEPLRDSTQVVYGIIIVAIDITEQVRARRILERVNDERQKLLSELESAGRAKDEFLATISHELRTPLTAMLGWARILREEDPDSARLQKGLEVIERNATVQAQLIEDILDVSRIVAGKVRLTMGTVNVGAVIRAAVETIRPTAVAKGVRIVVEHDGDLGEITADEHRVQQIVWNLLSNAVKFSKKEGTVFVHALRERTRLAIRVRDEGKGISPAFLPHVFDRFRQDDASTTKPQAGLGLGLAIVRHLVELHGGRVAAESDGEGRGATFEVEFPVELRAALIATPFESDITAPDVQLLSAIRVLVVDDQDDSRELVATVLSDVGAKVKQARSVAEAFDVLAVFDAHVIVSDIGMPGEDGYQFVRRLRSSDVPGQREIPAIALSAYARAEDRDRAVEAGFHEYAAKPIDPRALVKHVAILAGLRKR
jgi:signal transduction histidine kinase/CheY-like chemotaxis protein